MSVRSRDLGLSDPYQRFRFSFSLNILNRVSLSVSDSDTYYIYSFIVLTRNHVQIEGPTTTCGPRAPFCRVRPSRNRSTSPCYRRRWGLPSASSTRCCCNSTPSNKFASGSKSCGQHVTRRLPRVLLWTRTTWTTRRTELEYPALLPAREPLREVLKPDGELSKTGEIMRYRIN